MIDWITELPLIRAEALKHHLLDPCLIMAIRRQEAGRPGRDFGVLSTSAPTYADQLHICCNTVIHRLYAFTGNPLIADPNDNKSLRYSAKFIRYLASIWAPVGAVNDPSNLNTYWPDAVIGFYNSFITEEKLNATHIG